MGRREETMETPWGASDHVEKIAEGIEFVSTPSHGGYRLDAERTLRVLHDFHGPDSGLCRAGWFEEDCDWAYVALTFPVLFPPEAQEAARRTVARLDGWRAENHPQRVRS